MATDTWMHAVTGLYMVCNGSRLLAYVPQISALVKTRRADGISVGSWLIFAVAHASTAAYALEMGSDAMLVWYGLANMALSLLVAALAGRAQWNKRNRAPVGGPAFYSADHASGSDGDRLDDRVDASLVDAVAGDQRQAVQVHGQQFATAVYLVKALGGGWSGNDGRLSRATGS